MKPLVCKQCGGTINPRTYVCEYCGTPYKNEAVPYTPVHVVYDRPNIHTVATRVAIPMEMMEACQAEGLSGHVLDRMTYELAKAIRPFLTIDVQDDYPRNCRTFQGKVRVVDPEYRFG